MLNPGIKKTGTVLQALDIIFAIIPVSLSRIRKINCFDCIFGNDCCDVINRIYEQETQLSPTNRATHLCKCNDVDDLKTCSLRCARWLCCVCPLPLSVCRRYIAKTEPVLRQVCCVGMQEFVGHMTSKGHVIQMNYVIREHVTRTRQQLRTLRTSKSQLN